ncbi:MAG: V-type ATP synthase subunit F [Acidimicrobiia bacterium]
MSAVVAIGERDLLDGFSLAGVRVEYATDPEECRRALADIGEDVGLLVLTPSSRRALEPLLERRPNLLWTAVFG